MGEVAKKPVSRCVYCRQLPNSPLTSYPLQGVRYLGHTENLIIRPCRVSCRGVLFVHLFGSFAPNMTTLGQLLINTPSKEKADDFVGF
jgi:hypothetical protein